MAISDKDKLVIYDALRQIHGALKAIVVGTEGQLDDWEENALDAVGSVLYLAEGVFAKMSN